MPISNPDICTAYYGSFINGFGQKNSDVDFTILTNSFIEEERVLLMYIYKILE